MHGALSAKTWGFWGTLDWLFPLVETKVHNVTRIESEFTLTISWYPWCVFLPCYIASVFKNPEFTNMRSHTFHKWKHEEFYFPWIFLIFLEIFYFLNQITFMLFLSFNFSLLLSGPWTLMYELPNLWLTAFFHSGETHSYSKPFHF